jgi:hypothetical protein
MISENRNKHSKGKDLDDDEKAFIVDIFHRDIVSRLNKLHARKGILNCGFAGDQFADWIIRFVSRGNGFEITEFEYDEDSFSMDLDL